MPRATQSVEDRFWSKVDRRGDNECWPWTASLFNNGYGQFFNGKTMTTAHRVAYELTYGSIPNGFTIDHVRDRGCTLLHCQNPAHLEAVTQRVNSLRSDNASGRNARKIHCPRGHPYDDTNTYVHPVTGWRQCRSCWHWKEPSDA